MDWEKMYGQFVREMPEQVDRERTWEWMKKSDLKVENEALIFAAQEQALRTNVVKFNIDDKRNSSLCRLCGDIVTRMNLSLILYVEY